MHVRPSQKNISPEVWALAEKDDVIITGKTSDDQRVLIYYKTYQAMKAKLSRMSTVIQDNATNAFDLNPYLQDFIDIFNNDDFEDITDDDHYFENYVRKLKNSK
ncbi:hypothetical protein JW960_06840 [candidate division KSB1 bacterium]|nr:hypothetical protein [candidate division KSB1 bacterium]